MASTSDQEIAEHLGIDYENDIPEEAKRHRARVLNISGNELRFAEIIPETGILRDYFDFASPLTDAPEEFHIIAGITALGAALKNAVYIQFGPQRIYPNIWAVLLAPTSFYRKSTVLSIAKKVLTKLDESLIYPNEFSPETMISILAGQPQGCFFWSEFSGVLSHFERSYMLGTKEFFTEIYDSPPIYVRKLKEREWKIHDASISILSASAFDWFNRRVKENDIRGGFLARFLYVPATEKTKRIAFPPEPDAKLGNQIVRAIHKVQKVHGKMDISGIASKYETWLFKHEDELLTQDSNADLLSGFYSRLSIYTLKFAMILELSHSGKLHITEQSLDRAINLTTYLKSSIKRLIHDEFAFSKDMADKKRLLKIITGNSGITYRKLLQNSHMLADRLKPVLDTLMKEGTIELKTNRYYLSTHEAL